MTTSEKFKYLATALGFRSTKEFAERLGVTHARLVDVMREKQKIPQDLVITLVTEYNVNANWLMVGIGDAFIGVIPNKIASDSDSEELTREEISLIDDFRHTNEQGKIAVKATARAMAEQELFKNRKVG